MGSNEAWLAASIDDIMHLAKLSLLFGRTPRATFHEDGRLIETDTDHTVMLGLISCSLAEKFYPRLDVGLVSQFALVHDLVEAYAGDTPTLKISDDEKEQKVQREHAALDRLTAELGTSVPFIPALISRYEERKEAEARFVKAVDKIIPKTTHILNRGATLRAQGITKAEAAATYEQQAQDLRQYAADFPEILELRDELVKRMMDAIE